MRTVQEGLWRPLTVIRAPAGYGKTTLVAQWLIESDRPVAWLSLDDDDNEPLRFLAYLLAALQRVRPEAIADLDRAALPADDVALEPLLAQLLIVPLAETSRPLVLVLDDFHAITNASVVAAVDWLIDNLPPCLHILITTRVAPALSFARRRARDEVTEINASALSFSQTEVASLMTERLGQRLDPSALSRLHERTEGWAAGLQLVSLALKRGGSFEEVLETISEEGDAATFLIREVLERLTPELRSFLLRTSILDRFNASLASAVTGDEDADALLLEALDAGLFLVPLDHRRRWFRFHHLFAQTLRALLTEDTQARLHRLASQWWLDAGDPRVAATYAIRAHAHDMLGAIVEAWGFEMLLISDLSTVQRWLKHLPDDALDRLPVAALCAGWLATLPIRATPDTARAARAVARARLAMTAQGASGERLMDLEAHAQAITSIATRPLGDLAASESHANATLDRLAACAPIPRSVISLQVGVLRVMMGQLEQALDPLASARRWAEDGRNVHAGTAAIGYRAWALRTLGRLDEARALCTQGQRYVEQQGAAWLGMAAHIHTEVAHLHFEAWALPEALSALDEALPRARTLNDPFLLISCLALKARVYNAAGEPDLADAALTELRPLAERDGHPVLVLWARAAEALLATSRGPLPAPPTAPTPDAYSSIAHDLALAQVRACADAGALEAGLHSSQALAQRAAARGWTSHLLDWEVESSVILNRLGRDEELQPTLTRAVTLARTTGSRRALCERRRALPSHDDAPDAWRALLAEIDPSTPSSNPPPAPSAPGNPSSSARAPLPPLDNPLSAREREVLSLVARGWSNPEIARSLFVSPGTIKTHIHRILRKLDVKNRLQATQKAQHHGFLDGSPDAP